MKPFKEMKYTMRAAVVCAGLLLLTACTPDAAPPADTAAVSDTHAEGDTLPDAGVVTLPDAETVPEVGTVPTESETDPPTESEVPTPVFSIAGGLLDAATDLSLTLPDHAPAGAYITYTTDGSEPSASGTVYRRTIPLLDGTDCTVVRAAVFGTDRTRLGYTVTMTYLKQGSTALRVVSLVTDPDHLYENGGLFSDREATGKAGEQPVSVEVIEADGKVVVRQDGAVRLAGAGSRTFDPANLRVIARKPEAFGADADKYHGRGKFHAALFGESAETAYDSFLLRTGGNDSLHQAREDFLRMNTLRDAVANNICADAETLLGGTVFAQRTLPVAVYLNGSFYGLLHMKEDFDENYIEAAYGLPETGVALLKGKKDGKRLYYNIESGSDADLADWKALCAYCVEHATAADYAEAYARVSEQLDVENFSRYYAVMLYLCNTDWPQNNTMVWRYTPHTGDGTAGKPYADGKWRAVIRDMDLCFALHDKASQTSTTTYSMADTDTFYRITVFYRDGGYRFDESLGLYDDTPGFQGLFDFLMRSEDFRRIFREDCEALMSDAFAELCRAEIHRYYALTTPEMPAHIALWQEKGEILSAYSFRHFKDAKQDMLDFVAERARYFERYLNEAMKYYE